MSSNITITNPEFDITNYSCSQNYLLLPALNEYTWSKGSRAFLYLLGLLWCFLGVAQVADIFMASIERITSKTRTVRIADPEAANGYQEVQLKVWNDTVANLSLLALGTSAPEILLSVIEIVGNDFVAGELGPGTIVGSAAFNLFFISAICIACIPDGEIRRISSIKVFAVTAFTCVFAYVWLALVLLAITPNVVDIWEAFVTLLFFPLLIIVAYLADKDFCMKKRKPEGEGSEFVGIPMSNNSMPVDNGEVTVEEGEGFQNPRMGEDKADGAPQPNSAVSAKEEDEMTRLAKELGRTEGMTPEEASKILTRRMEEERPHGRGWYRMNAIRGLSGGRKLYPQVAVAFEDAYKRVKTPDAEQPEGPKAVAEVDHSKGGTQAVVQFTAATVAVMENEGTVRLGIKRTGFLDKAVSVRVETINGTALAGEDYKTFAQTIKFKKKEALREVHIEIVDDCEWEPDEFFFVKLRPEPANDNCVLGNISICQVTIINDDEPGVLTFAKPSFVIKETGLKALIPVVRMGGADGHVSVKWSTKDITAIEGKDYTGKSGQLTFDNQETTKSIIIPLFESNKEERDESFQIDLGETDGGATIGKIGKTIVTIVNDEEFNGLVSRIMNMTKTNLDALELHKTSYAQQFVEAMNVNGGDIETATFLDYILHFCTFFWKVLFATIPPSQYCGGWPAFLVSLAMIGFMTAIIGDLASIFGCLIGLKDAITAITLVALGTSMPDTFASKTAAIMEKSADSSVGNVNGSNSVNVFLGLGITWVIGSLYWYAKDQPFYVPAGSLGFSVIIYTIAAVIALSILVARRMIPSIGAELGGPKLPKIVCAVIFISLWVLYIVLSSLQAEGIISVQIGSSDKVPKNVN